MARFLPATSILLIQLTLLVLLSSCSTIKGFSLEDRVQQLTENYDKIKGALVTKDAQFEALEQKVQEQEFELIRLKETVQQQELLLADLQNERRTNSQFIWRNSLGVKEQSAAVGKSMFSRTCQELRAADPSLSSGMHWIDPDGQGVGDDPIYVYCDMTKGFTSVVHDSEASIDVGHCADPGCYSRNINYNATMRQMIALAELSSECHQSIQYDCNYTPLELNGVTYAWWNDKEGQSQTFWAGNNADVHTCQCGINHNCAESTKTCNCDSNAPVLLTDRGVITDKNYLPITRLNFGQTQLASSSGVHTLGRFECSGQVFVIGMPSSCEDLWRIGHSLNGLYSVMGSTQVESVYCDFTQLPSDSGFQTRIGYVDVKSSPVYFYVQRNSDFGTKNVSIPFEVERLNIGGAMDLSSGIFTAPQSGTYFFSFSGISNQSGADFEISLYINGVYIAAGCSWRSIDTQVFQSTLHLNAGDKVSLQIIYGSGALHDHTGGLAGHFTHFTGWLLEEDFAFYVLNI